METKRDYIVRLRELLIARLNLDELRTLCFDIGLDYDSLEGGTKDSKIRELLSHVERRDELAFLIERVKGQRPDLARDIVNLEEVLRRRGVVVEDHPDDEALPDPGAASTHQQSNKRQLYRQRTGRWLWMTVGGIVMILVAIGFWRMSHPIPNAEKTRADRSTAISTQSTATTSTIAPFATPVPIASVPSLPGGDVNCLTQHFADIDPARQISIEVGATNQNYYISSQDLSEKDFHGPLGIRLTQNGKMIAALSFLFFSDNRLFKITSVVDSNCQAVAEYSNWDRGGDRNALQDSDTLKIGLTEGSFSLRFIFYGPDNLRFNFQQSR